MAVRNCLEFQKDHLVVAIATTQVPVDQLIFVNGASVEQGVKLTFDALDVCGRGGLVNGLLYVVHFTHKARLIQQTGDWVGAGWINA